MIRTACSLLIVTGLLAGCSESTDSASVPVDATPPDELTLSIFWNMLKTEPLRLILPWLVGGYILCVIAILMGYPVYLYLIKGAQKARARVAARRRRKETS